MLGLQECSELSMGFPLDSHICGSNQQVQELVGFQSPQCMVILSHFGCLALSMEDDSSGSNSTNGACPPYSSSFTSPPYPMTLGDCAWTSMCLRLPGISSFMPPSTLIPPLGHPHSIIMMSCILLILTPRAGHLVTSSGTCTLPCRNPNAQCIPNRVTPSPSMIGPTTHPLSVAGGLETSPSRVHMGGNKQARDQVEGLVDE